jgi:hypothetical protein
MSDSLELRPIGQTEGASRVPQIAANAQVPRIATSEKTPVTKSAVSTRQVYALVVYYTILLIVCMASIAILVGFVSDPRLFFDASQNQSLTADQNRASEVQATPTAGQILIDRASDSQTTSTASQTLYPEQKRKKMLISMAFLITGAIVGSVLYLIRELFRFYVKEANFDPRWLGKYFSAPWEAAALAVAVMSIVQGGAVFLGGSGIDFSAGKPFTVFGFGAVVGFGVREVVGWVGGVTKSMFPAPADGSAQSKIVRSNRRNKDS